MISAHGTPTRAWMYRQSLQGGHCFARRAPLRDFATFVRHHSHCASCCSYRLTGVRHGAHKALLKIKIKRIRRLLTRSPGFQRGSQIQQWNGADQHAKVHVTITGDNLSGVLHTCAHIQILRSSFSLYEAAMHACLPCNCSQHNSALLPRCRHLLVSEHRPSLRRWCFPPALQAERARHP